MSFKLKENLKKIILLRKLVTFLRRLYNSNPKFISLVLTFEMYAPYSDGEPNIKTKLTKNTINNIFNSILIFSNEINNKSINIIDIDNLKFNKSEEASVKELKKLLNFHGSDKAHKHFYHLLYAKLLSPNEKVKNILEIGLGTNNTNFVSSMGINGKPGASLRAFSEFCKNANIYGADIDRAILFNEKKIKTFFVDQTSNESLDKLKNNFKEKFDLIIDDGLHSPDANINTIRFALDLIKVGGSIVIEDINPKSISIWKSISYLIPSEKYKTQIIKAKGALMFLITKTKQNL